ncbi:MAG: hypothetical protein DRI56_08980 [Chloroflexota bacterium]|nr:MAG: hypothetical protein DRI56_08980 [Chloroflexota bacterium]
MTVNLSKIRQYLEEAKWFVVLAIGVFIGVVIVTVVVVSVSTGSAFASEPTSTPLPTALPTLLPTATTLPSPTPTQAPSPTPTPETVYVIWSAHAEKVNMREEPAGYILAAVANGVAVNPLNEIVESNGYTWVKVEVEDRTGWIANLLIWEAVEGYRTLDGTRDCYSAKEGPYRDTLFNGTPYLLLATDEKWMRVQLLDEKTCWLPIE